MKKTKESSSEIISIINNLFLSRNLSLFIGSGCSTPTIPLIGATFEIIKKDPLVQNCLGEFSESSDLENYLNWLISGIKYFKNSNEFEYQKCLNAYNVTLDILLSSISIIYPNETLLDYIYFYNKIFEMNKSKKNFILSIFTTNYDLFNESALEKIGVNYTSGFRGDITRRFDPSIFRYRLVDSENRYKDKWIPLKNFAKLFKLHGSINWKMNDGIVVQEEKPIKKDEVIIFPSIDKHNETNKSPYSELFRELSLNLQSPNTTLIILGYGFSDDHINQLIIQSCENEDFVLLSFVNKNEIKVKMFMDKVSSRRNCHFIGGVENGVNSGHYFKVIASKYLGQPEEIISQLNSGLIHE